VIPISVTAQSPSFSITGVPVGLPLVSTSSTGYSAVLRIGSTLSLLAAGSSVRIGNVTLWLDWSLMSQNSALLSFRLENSGRDATVDIAISNDAYLEATDCPPIASIGADQAFVVYTDDYSFTWVCRGSPLVTDVSTYWFGSLENINDNN
jgi:hypothetical protein